MRATLIALALIGIAPAPIAFALTDVDVAVSFCRLGQVDGAEQFDIPALLTLTCDFENRGEEPVGLLQVRVILREPGRKVPFLKVDDAMVDLLSAGPQGLAPGAAVNELIVYAPPTYGYTRPDRYADLVAEVEVLGEIGKKP
jgi:hypothetical protein